MRQRQIKVSNRVNSMKYLGLYGGQLPGHSATLLLVVVAVVIQ